MAEFWAMVCAEREARPAEGFWQRQPLPSGMAANWANNSRTNDLLWNWTAGLIDFICLVPDSFWVGRGPLDVGGRCRRYLAGFGSSYRPWARRVCHLHSRLPAH